MDLKFNQYHRNLHRSITHPDLSFLRPLLRVFIIIIFVAKYFYCCHQDPLNLNHQFELRIIH